MKVFVTGATGFLGSWVVRELIARGHSARVLVRPTSKLTNLESLPLERSEGDVLDEASVRRGLEGCDAVIHTAGVASFAPEEREKVYAVNVGGVERVLGAALEAGVKRAVLTSSIASIGGLRTPRIADETTPSNVESTGVDYMISKYQGEQRGLALARKGLPLAIVRPGFITGPGDIYRSSATTLMALAKGKLPVYVDGGGSFVDVRDVAQGHVAALEQGRPGELYNLGGHNLEMREMVAVVARVAGTRPPRRVPYAIAAAAATAADAAGRFGLRLDMSSQLLKASALYTFVTSAKAERELGYRIRPFEESVRDTLRFFIEQKRLKPFTEELRRLSA